MKDLDVYRYLITRLPKSNPKYSKHVYDIELSPTGKQCVRRDGREMKDVINVQTNLIETDAGTLRPILTLTCCANIDNMLESQWSKSNCYATYHIDNDPTSETVKVYRNGELMEEVSKVEIYRDADDIFLTKLKLNVYADVNIHWSYCDKSETEKTKSMELQIDAKELADKVSKIVIDQLKDSIETNSDITY